MGPSKMEMYQASSDLCDYLARDPNVVELNKRKEGEKPGKFLGNYRGPLTIDAEITIVSFTLDEDVVRKFPIECSSKYQIPYLKLLKSLSLELRH